jgi:hypothetical protein
MRVRIALPKHTRAGRTEQCKIYCERPTKFLTAGWGAGVGLGASSVLL